MKAFRRERDGSVSAVLEPEEVELLVQLATESAALADAARAGAGLQADPALIRLLPDAYPGDPAASAEFRRFTADGLAERKATNARVVVETLASAGAGRIEVRLDTAASTSWLRAITDIRLVIGARLGIVQDGDEGDVHDTESALMRAAYDWLAWVQESLVNALTPR
ncbi:DUF2017 domain-containing protein [Leifsonia poae]|uniref:DUF2017 domain-containing protein n=1 Tax=Leifsonia poae TaxID=110933 RepID=A0A9W6HCP3_9MICO|nr:DUF2017 domain-containing protein [Leifsonia poae]GLJ77635.1 hypothetical protein GCM10017584_32090 [Leifsonia poae]